MPNSLQPIPPIDPLFLPDEWLEDYRRNNLDRRVFFAKLMDCVTVNDVGEVIRCLPANLFDSFKTFVSSFAKMEVDEDILVVGGKIHWVVSDAKRVHQWLEEHPSPQLAEPDAPKQG